MDLVDALIIALLRLLVPWLPGAPDPRLPRATAPIVVNPRADLSTAGPPAPVPMAERPDPEIPWPDVIEPAEPVTPEPREPEARSEHADVVDDIPEPDFLAQLEATFKRVPEELRAARNEAYRLGVEEAGGEHEGDRYTRAQDKALRDWWEQRYTELLVLLDDPDIGQEVVAARAQSLIERETSTQLSRAQDEGLAEEAQRRGLYSYLVPERDACVICAGYAGSIAAPGGEFAVVRIFTEDTEMPDVVIPVHPRCRCKRRVVRDVGSAETAAVPLRREAERAILRFEKLDSESDRVRTEAAARLLELGSSLPKTVVERAGRAVRRRRKDEGPKRPRNNPSAA